MADQNLKTRTTTVSNDGGLALVINGEPVQVRASVLAQLLDELGYAGRKVATAVNGDFVPEKARAATRLAADDAIEIVAPRQGG